MERVRDDLGWIEVICGPMFSGKTEELIRRLKRVHYAKRKLAIFKPAIDVRYSTIELVSHAQSRLEAVPISGAHAIFETLEDDVEIVGIDEVQFFDSAILDVVQALANSGRRVIVAGLDLDYRGAPFGPMPHLLSVAESITKLLAICVQCGSPASRSQRLNHEKKKFLLGAEDSYEPRCRSCHYVEIVRQAPLDVESQGEVSR
jgi:thymidine kinase